MLCQQALVPVQMQVDANTAILTLLWFWILRVPFKLDCEVFCAELNIKHNSDHSSVIILRRFACTRSPGMTTNL